MNVQQLSEKRYSTKSFDTTRKIADADFEQLKAVMRNSPSSVNIQPWHFVIANTEAGKARIAKAAEKYPFNIDKIKNASHVVVFAAKTMADDGFLSEVLEKEDQDGRYDSEESRNIMDSGRKYFLGIHRDVLKDETEWLSKQVYINLGFTLMAAAAAGIDSLTMEGVDLNVLNEEFGLTEKGFTAVAVVSFGYHTEDDFNAALPKSRLADDVIFSQA